ncbi:MAG: diguanylate cyclase, partial [Bradyrhizobium sp.]|nr:diguanylate cyclase [Bradyrhizobium sp.]
MRKLASGVWGSFAEAIGSRRILASMSRGPIFSLILCGGLLVAAIVVGTMVMVGEFRERALTNSERELDNTVLLLTRHFDQQFEDTEIIASDVIARMKFSEIASAETFRTWMSSHDAHLIL